MGDRIQMGIKKSRLTLKSIFIRYLVTLCVVISILFSIYAVIIMYLFENNIIIPANYSEKMAYASVEKIKSAPEVTEEIIPMGSKYILFDLNYNVIKKNLNDTYISEAKSFLDGTYKKGSIKNYIKINRKNEICVLQYFLAPHYNSELLEEYFPNAQIMFIVISLILLIFSIIITTSFYAKKLNKKLDILNSATQKIKDRDLDFDIQYSDVKEIDDVLNSISDMKEELKNSLETQWNLEQNRKDNIASLAHDIKTPLTIIKGNAELLSEEENFNMYQKDCISYITKNVSQLEKYTKTLMEISSGEKSLHINTHDLDCNMLVVELYNQAKALASIKSIDVSLCKTNLPKSISADKELLSRAIINIISNAIDYTNKGRSIEFIVEAGREKIIFTIIDTGNGFSKKDLKYALEQFYMNNESRTTGKHYGMGLHIANIITKMHNGNLTISNSCDNGGGKVCLEIPLK